MLARIAVSTVTCLIAVLSGLPGQASADPGDGVGVFHDRVVKRDRPGTCPATGRPRSTSAGSPTTTTRPGDRERLVVTVRFADFVRAGSELNWGASTGPGGYSLGFKSRAGGKFTLERDNRVVRRRHVRRAVEGNRVTITIPWRKLGSPRKLVGFHFWATFDSPFPGGIDKAFKSRAVLH